MQRALLLLLSLALLVFLGPAAPTSQSAPAPDSTCCQKMQQMHDDCRHQQPKSKPNQVCCAICVIGLAVLPESSLAVPAPDDHPQIFAGYSFLGQGRAERPPTIASLALVGSATATSQSDCCPAEACCPIHLGCCH